MLKTATEIPFESEDEFLSLEEAERIAAEAGIQPSDFRAAVAFLTSARSGKGSMFGPQGTFSAEASIGYRVPHDRAAHMLAQAQLKLSTGGKIEVPAEGLWRLSDSGSLLQVATLGSATTMSATSDRRRMKAALIGGSGMVGAFGGVAAATAVALVGWGSVEAMALAQLVGASGGAIAGVAAGVAGWRSVARRNQERVFSALERMRTVAETSLDEGGDRLDSTYRAIP